MSKQPISERKLTRILDSNFLWICLFLLLNVILRSFQLVKNPLSGDEPFSLFHAQMEPSKIISELTKGNNPPLFELILHYWLEIKNISISWARILPLLFSVLTAPFLFLLAKEIKKGFFPIVITLIYSFSTYQLQYAHEIRVYSLFGLLTVISMLLFLKINRQHKLKYWIAFLLTNILLIYAHYFGFFVLFIQTIAILSIREFRKNIKAYTIYVVAMVILYLPLIFVVLSRLGAGSGGTWLAPPSSMIDLYEMLWRFSNKPVVTVICIVLLVSAIIKYLISKDKRLEITTKLLLIWFCVSFFGMFLISYKIPMFLDRYLIYCSFSYLLLVSYCIFYLFSNNKISIAFASIVILLFAGTFLLNKPTERDAPRIVETVKNAKQQGYEVTVTPMYYITNFVYYYDKSWFKLTGNSTIYDEIDSKLKNDGVYFAWDIIDNIPKSSKWLLIEVAPETELQNSARMNFISKRFHLVKSEKLDEVTTAYFFDNN